MPHLQCRSDRPLGESSANIYIDPYQSSDPEYRCFTHLSERRRREIETREESRRHAKSDELEDRCRELREEIEEISTDRDELKLTLVDDLAVVDRDLATTRFTEMLAELEEAEG
jgi:hypothetical protein